VKYPALPNPPRRPLFLGLPLGTPQGARRTRLLQTVAPWDEPSGEKNEDALE
jgi:hypothetical protein